MTAIQLIQQAVRTLGKQEQQVLGLLYGLAGAPQHSLEEVSRNLGVPLKAVVEMDTAAVRRLRHPTSRKMIMQGIEDGEQQIWDALSLSGSLVFKKELGSTTSARLPGEFLVAIKCLIGTVDQWLSDHSSETPKAWYRGPYPVEQLLKTVDRLESIQNEMCLPTPLPFLSKFLHADLDLVIMAVALADWSSIFKGYFVNSAIGIRIARAVHMHRILSFERPDTPVTPGQVMALYNKRHPDDPVTARETEIILDTKPHLFLPVGYLVWCVVEAITEDLSHLNWGAPPLAPEMDGRILRHLPGKREPEKNPEDVLHEILAAKGPSRLEEIAHELVGTMGDSLKFVRLKTALGSSCRIVTLAPEVYALEEQRPEAQQEADLFPLLLTSRQCKLYMTARHAGEPMGAYALWTPLMEQKMCFWAEQHAGRKLFRSLLAVADPLLWDAHEAVKKAWSFKKQLLGHYFLEFNLKPFVWDKPPSLLPLFSVAVSARQSGYMNWLQVQNILGQQLFTQFYEQDEAPVLAILIGLEALTPPDHWQKVHFTAPALNIILPELSYELHKTGNLRWSDPIGRELLSRLEAASRQRDMGWLCPKDLARLAKALIGPQGKEKANHIPSVEKELEPPDVKGKPFTQLRMPFKSLRTQSGSS